MSNSPVGCINLGSWLLRDFSSFLRGGWYVEELWNGDGPRRGGGIPPELRVSPPRVRKNFLGGDSVGNEEEPDGKSRSQRVVFD